MDPFSDRLNDMMRLVPDSWTKLVARGLLRTSNAFGRASPAATSDRLPFSSTEYRAWIHRYDRLTAADRRAIRRHIERFGHRPAISLLLQVQRGRDAELARTGESLRRQLYPHWELICVSPCGSSDRPADSKVLHDLLTQEPRIKWLPVTAETEPSACLDAGANAATGQYLAFMTPGDTMPAHALYQIALEADRHPGADLIYTDHDESDHRGHRSNPHFKPDWDPDFALSVNYLGRAIVFREGYLRSLGGFVPQANASVHGLVHRCAAAGSQVRVRHIPKILYHAAADSYGDPVVEPRIGRRRGRSLPEPTPRVSIIVPTRDGGEGLRRCIGSVLTKTTYPQYELLVVDNQSLERGTLEYLQRIGDDLRVRILRYDAPFNYSAINNYAVRQARGEIIALLNDDVEIINREWLLEMVSHAACPEVGAVGAKLYYPDDTLQHGGIIVGLDGKARHIHKGAPRDAPGYLDRLRVVHSVSAVTGACLVVRKAVYKEVGGLDADNLPIALNDVDFCLRLMEAGYRNLWTPLAELYHIESATRGYGETPREVCYFKSKWQGRLENDFANNPNLSLKGDAFQLAWPPRAERPCTGGLKRKAAGALPGASGTAGRLRRSL